MPNPSLSNIQLIQEIIEKWLLEQLPPDKASKFEAIKEKLTTSNKDHVFYFTFSALPSKLGKEKWHLNASQIQKAKDLRSGWQPENWTTDIAARVWMVLQLATNQEETYFDKLEKLFLTADKGEQVALYNCLPLIPSPDLFKARAAEGIRTNMTEVFDAISLNNPYPADYLDTLAWNQMVLKAAFMDRPIYRIYGLEKRANAELARIISDYAHERWSAGRVVSPEFWRSVGPFLDPYLLEDVKKLFNQPNTIQQETAALLCHQSEFPQAKELLQGFPLLKEKVENNTINWDQIATDWWAQK